MLNSSRVNGYQHRLTAEFLLFVANLHVRIQPQSPCVRKDIAKNRFSVFGQMARSEGPFALRAVLNPRGVIVNLLAGGLTE